MHIEFALNSGLGYLDKFAKRLNLEIIDNVLSLPPQYGSGFAKIINIDDDLLVIIHSYCLNEPVSISCKATNTDNNLITFQFISHQESDNNYLSNIQVLNDTIDVHHNIEKNTPICYVIVKIKIKKLISMLGFTSDTPEITTFADHLNRPFVYQEAMTLEMKEIIRELSGNSEHGKLEKFYYKIRVMELIYQFFIRFSRRATYDFTNVSKNDIEKILSLESLILHDLKTPPKLSELAHSICMSESKMKQLFKKIYGDSIYISSYPLPINRLRPGAEWYF